MLSPEQRERVDRTTLIPDLIEERDEHRDVLKGQMIYEGNARGIPIEMIER